MNEAADAAVRAGGLESLAIVLTHVSQFDGLERRALLRTLLREHFEALQKSGGPLPIIAEYLTALPDAEEQAVVREVFAEQLPMLRVELGREIGRGGMGVIYEGRQTAVGGRRVAVKMLDVGLVNQAALWNRLREEVDILAQIPSPNVVQVFDVGLISGQLAVVMELAEQNLQERTGGLPQDQREAAQIVRKLAVAVQKAHDHPRKLIHQDLKPSNVLVMPDGEYKVADFGLSHSATATDAPTAARIVGTPGWLAPEQARGQPPTFATDVWGLGTVLYFMLTGAAPFPPKRDQIDAVLTEPLADAVLRRKTAGGDVLDPKLAAIVSKSLQKDPAQRYRRPIELAQDLQRYLNAEPVQAANTGRPKRSAAARFAAPVIITVVCIAAAIPITQWAMSGKEAKKGSESADPPAATAPATTSAPASTAGATTQPIREAESKPSEKKETDAPPPSTATDPGGDASKSTETQPPVAKPAARPAIPVSAEGYYFARDFPKGTSDCEFDLPVDDNALALMPDDVRKVVAADPLATLQESWVFETKTVERNEKRLFFTRTLKVHYGSGAAAAERTLDTRYGQCKTDVAAQFFKPGKHHFITEASFGSLREQQRTLSTGPDDPARNGKMLWKGATKNFYELSGKENDDLVIWGLIPKRD